MLKKIKQLGQLITKAPGNLIQFFKSVGTEMQKTEFPGRAQSYKLANVVLTGSLVMSLLLFGIDALFIFIRTYLTNLNK